MIRDLLLVAFLAASPIGAGAAVGAIVDAALNLRDLRRTGHVSACLAPAGWDCTCEPAATPGRRA